jgi:glycosyltransferase involved in cell wall biosynthesis
LTTVIPEVALVHDYFVQDGGAERVAIELARMFPAAPIYTTFFEGDRFGDRIDPARIHRWPIPRRIGPSPWFRPLLPAYVAHYSRLRIEASRLLLSTSSTFARAASPRGRAIHVAYIHTPLRFAWDVNEYLRGSSFPGPARVGLRAGAPILRKWDRWAGRRPDVLIANSENVRRRIAASWQRDSVVIHPPVDVASRSVSKVDDGFLLVVTRLLAYKRVELAVMACRRLDRELVVVGDGPERRRLEALAGPRTKFLGHVPRAVVGDLMARCHALITPGIEDFGIAPVEAMASGKRVIAYAAGGALETVVDGQTGTFFAEPTTDALIGALERLESIAVDPSVPRARAMTFDRSVFERRLGLLIADLGLTDVVTPRDARPPKVAATRPVAALAGLAPDP